MKRSGGKDHRIVNRLEIKKEGKEDGTGETGNGEAMGFSTRV